MNDYVSELGEFRSEPCMDDEFVDPFFDPVNEYDCGIPIVEANVSVQDKYVIL